jgi:hypothetical protein
MARRPDGVCALSRSLAARSRGKRLPPVAWAQRPVLASTQTGNAHTKATRSAMIRISIATRLPDPELRRISPRHPNSPKRDREQPHHKRRTPEGLLPPRRWESMLDAGCLGRIHLRKSKFGTACHLGAQGCNQRFVGAELSSGQLGGRLEDLRVCRPR